MIGLLASKLCAKSLSFFKNILPQEFYSYTEGTDPPHFPVGKKLSEGRNLNLFMSSLSQCLSECSMSIFLNE